MTDITPLAPEGRQIIESYGPGRFSVSGQVWQGSLLITPQQTEQWDIRNYGAIDDPALLALGQALHRLSGGVSPDLLLIGAGNEHPPPDSRLRSLGYPVEVMRTDSACRTYNILMVEGRRVAVALIAM